MKLHFKFNIVLIFFAYSIFIGCSTDISSLEYDVKQTHIPQSFENAKPFSETFSIKNIEDSKNTQSHSGTQDSKDWQNAKNTQDSKDSTQSTEPFSLKEFSTLIDDKHLHNLLHIALKNNTDVLIMASRIKQAQSQMKINTANMFPTINVGLNSSYIDNRTLSQSTIVRPGANSINANISMSWEVDLFGKLNALRQSSKKAYLQAQSNLSSVQISLIAQVATLYFTLRENAHSLQIAKATLENLEQIESINKQKYNQTNARYIY